MSLDFVPSIINPKTERPVGQWEKPSFQKITDSKRIVAVLASLDAVEYDQYRESQAKALGIRVATLDKQVAKLRPKDPIHDVQETEKNGREIELYEPEPWPEPVDGAGVLDEAFGAITLFMSIREEHAVTCALWAVHTHLFKDFSHSPRLAINAPAESCGKTLLLQLVGGMVPRPEFCEMMKPAPFFRMAEKYKPAFMIDECDVFIREDSDLLAALNNGWEPHGGVVRCVGDDFEPRRFSTFTPVALGAVKIHKVLPATTLSRSFLIELERALPGEILEPFDRRVHQTRLLDIGRKLARWAADHREALRNFDPQMPEGSFNRRADKWRPLFAIAQMAGGDWPTRVKEAYLIEERESEKNSKLSNEHQLLSDIRKVLRPDEHVIATEEMIGRLCSLDDSQWADYNFKERDPERRKIQPRQISNLLRDYKITPGTVRIGNASPKGYKRIQFKIAWQRYLSDT
ncbi:MAG: DUF3631 domain-containing protein, partial [Methylococcaceae bacterium]|nr:DUF3631 domain-containing protein [Methylococcaceae bacterium]